MRTPVLLAMVVMSLLSSSAQSEDLSCSALVGRIESLETELAQQQAEFASFRASVAGQEACECNARSWYGDYEMTILRPFFSDLAAGPGFHEDFGIGHRFTLGVENHQGYGVRARYWMQNESMEGYGFYVGETLQIDMDALDIDLTLREKFRRWDLLLSGGVRYGRNGYSSDTLLPPGEAKFEGFGPTFSFQADRKLGCRGLHVIGNFRASLLFGDANFFGDTAEGELSTVFDTQLGLGWRRPLGSATLDLRAVWESQVWQNNAMADTIIGLGTNQGFTGPTVAAELRF